MSRRIVCGDIHGNYKALKQCLERSEFDYKKDVLIQLGDICDGYNEVFECVEELMKIRSLFLIEGNHDEWFKQWLEWGDRDWGHGGFGTLQSYGFNCLGKDWEQFQMKYVDGAVETNLEPKHVPAHHKIFFQSQVRYIKGFDNRLFVHGGFNRHHLIKDQDPVWLSWDRDLWYGAVGAAEIEAPFRVKEDATEIYIGHTATTAWKTTKYMNRYNIYNVDCGAGFNGRLCFLDIDTKETWYSDIGSELYPDFAGRRVQMKQV